MNTRKILSLCWVTALLLCSATAASSELKQIRPGGRPGSLEPVGPEIERNIPSRREVIPVRTQNDNTLQLVPRGVIDAVVAEVKQSVWVDGNLQLLYDNSSISAGDSAFAQDVIGTMGLNFAITSLSDRLDSDGDRYGLTPRNSAGENRLEIWRRRYTQFSTTNLIQSSLQLDPTIDGQQLGVLLYAQKHYPINGNPDSVIDHQASGLSVFQTVYGGNGESFNLGEDERLAYGISEESIVPDIDGDDDPDGVTPLGEDVLESLIANHIVIDLSHASDESVLDTVAQVGDRVPVMANHTVAQEISEHMGGSRARGLKDESIVAIARTGGVIGLTPLKHFVIGDDSECDSDLLTSEFVRHINYMVDVIEADESSDLVGSEHVGFGSDSYIDGWASDPRWTSCELNGLDRWEQVLRRLAAEKDEAGRFRYSIQDLKNIAGLNYLRVFKQVLPGYSQPQVPTLVRLQQGARFSQYRFDWNNVSVRSAAARSDLTYRPEDVRYQLFLYGEAGRSSRLPYVQIATPISETSDLTLTYLAMMPDQFQNYKGFIRAFDKNNPEQYIDSEAFYFSLD